MNSIQKKNLYQLYTKPILFVSVLLLMGGIFSYTHMQKNLFPEVQFPRITLIADAGQQPVERMMITVTKPLESAVKKVTGVSVVKSSTGRGSCVIDIYFEWGLDIYAKKLELESRVSEIQNFLPVGTVLSAEVMNQSLFPVFGYTLKSTTHSPIEMRDVGKLIVRPLFSQVSGISNVVVRGGKAKEFVVIPDAVRLSALGLTPHDIADAFTHTNFVLGNGNVAGGSRLYLTLTDTRINDLEELKQTIIRNDGFRIVRLEDVAKVDIEEQQEFMKINADGEDAVLIDLVKQPGVNLIDFAAAVEEKAGEVRKALPAGYELTPYYNQSAFVGDSVNSVLDTIVEGLFLALVVIILFLRSWRASLVVMCTIPVTIAFSLLLVYLAGISINIMSLGAIAASVGLIIDDAVVIIEQIYREHEEHPSITPFEAVHTAISNLFPAMVASSLSTIVIHFPFRLMSGLAGSFFKELSDTMQLTLAASFLVTWLLLPVFHLIFGYRARGHILTKEEEIGKVGWLTSAYRKPVFAAAIAAVLLAGGLTALQHISTGFLPELDEGTIVLDYHSPSGTDIEETDRMCREMEKIILKHPDVETYSRRTALGMSFKTCPCNFGDYLIQLKKSRSKSTPQVINDLRTQISHCMPSMTIEFGQRISDLLGDLMSTPQPVEVKIFGDDYEQLQKIAARAETLMKQVKGVVDIDNGLVAAGPSLMFVPNKELLSQYGISLDNFQEQLTACVDGVPLGLNANVNEPNPAQAAMTGGLQIGSIQDGEQMRRVIMRFTSYKENSPQLLTHQPVFLSDGSTRPLSLFCSVSVLRGEIEQKREDLKSDITLTARLDARDLGGAVNELKQLFSQKLQLPPGYSVHFGGAYAQQQQSFKELFMILGLAVLLVFGVLMFLFRRWMISGVVLLLSVMGISGSLIALWMTGVPLNVSSYTGIIMVVGIIAENAIFTVYQYKKNREEGGNVNDSVDYAIALRIRPKLMTALSAILALMPLAMGLGMGAQMQQPLAVAVIGGFCAGLPLLLVVLPTLMRRLFKERQ